MTFTGLMIVCAVAFTAPLVLGFFPRIRLAAIVVEILAGIAIGPAGLGWVTLDEPIRVLSMLGLAFLLFLAGLELDVRILAGRRLRLTVGAFAASLLIAYALAATLRSAGLVESALLVAVCLSATALGIIAPVLKDARESATPFGQLIIAASSIADFGTVLVLSLLFSRESTSGVAKLVLIGGFAILIAALVVTMRAAERLRGLQAVLLRLQDSTSQIRIRGAFLLMVALTALAEGLGLEVILGAFAAGGLLAVLDRDYAQTHPKFREKLEAVGFGVFIPVFFVASGLRFDASALFAGASTIARVPIFLVALLLARGLPAWLYRPLIGPRRVLPAALLQATSLPFIVAATAIGVELDVLSASNASALVAAGLLSVIIFPMAAMALLRAEAPASSEAVTRTV
jgi:Kef-type K+ transport system membrane component KefB